MSLLPTPLRGEVWSLNLDPIQGREQRGVRPALVVSADALNRAGAELAIVVPLTSHDKGIPSHVHIAPPEGGVSLPSWALVEHVRSVYRGRFIKRFGAVPPATMLRVETVLRRLLGL
jgi:mRNA interferase MazF